MASAGGVFKLICNDGKADRMIMATMLLVQRIKDVMCARKRAGKADITPTLVDLERTHILFVNAHFKPYAAIGNEYNKARPQTGNPTLKGGVTFSIPQFGDFFHDMVCRVRLSQFTGNAGFTPACGSTSFPFDAADGSTTYNIVDVNGQMLVQGGPAQGEEGPGAPVQYRNFVRYCEYPGNRLFSQVKFDVNGNPLDAYNEMVPVMLEKFCTPPHKRTGHNRLVGQEVPLVGYSGLRCATVSDSDAANTPSGITKGSSSQSNHTVGLFNQNAAALGSAAPGSTVVGQTALAPLNDTSGPGPLIDVSRKLQKIVNGPQTPKPVQPPLEIWNKLRFWFNDDVRLSIPSVSIPFGQRYISIEHNDKSMLGFEYPSIYLETTTNTATSRAKTYTPIFQQLGTTDINIENHELYINNIFVNPEIHDIYIKRIGFSLIRVYRQHTQRHNQESSDEVLLSQLKWPIEYMFVGLRPVWNVKDVSVGTGGLVTGGNQNHWRDWHRMTRMVDARYDEPSLTDLPGGGGDLVSSIGQVMPDQYYLPVPTVDTMSLTSHGITIFDGFKDTFFNQYLPFHYGGTSLVTPEDHGALFINMALFPRSYQPSGHLNVSRARETYLKWTSSYVSSRTPIELHAVAVAINFLLITDGSAVLRYST
jgi:hypothetical protein